MISIVIPTYNRLLSLKLCIQSAIAQYYEGLEIVIIDDCSTDSTGKFLNDLRSDHPYIKSIFNDRNLGVNYSRNRGIEAATKDYILFLDSDDTLKPDSLKYLVNCIVRYSDTQHFLYVVSYRDDEFKNCPVRKIYYQDWLNSKIIGDFTHLVKSSIMKKYLFFEQFRMFEYLNWLRIKKESSPQLLLPFVTTIVNRNREDSLSRTAGLKDESSIRSKFEAQHLYYTMYYEDLRLYKSSALKYRLLYSIILGNAVKEKIKARELISYAQRSYLKALAKILLQFPPNLTLSLITVFSGWKNSENYISLKQLMSAIRH